MKVDLISKKENPLLKRSEMEFRIDHTKETTPSLPALQQFLSKHIEKPAEHIEIKSIYSGHGTPTAKAVVFVWEESKVQDLSKIEKVKSE